MHCCTTVNRICGSQDKVLASTVNMSVVHTHSAPVEQPCAYHTVVNIKLIYVIFSLDGDQCRWFSFSLVSCTTEAQQYWYTDHSELPTAQHWTLLSLSMLRLWAKLTIFNYRCLHVLFTHTLFSQWVADKRVWNLPSSTSWWHQWIPGRQK